MAVLPENMDKLDVENVPGSLSIIQEYIRYMGERIEFSFRNMTRTVSNAGISSTELYILMQAQAQQLAALSSVVSGAIGDITSLQHDVADLKADVSSADGKLTGLQGDLAEMQAALSGLDARVTALENQAPAP